MTDILALSREGFWDDIDHRHVRSPSMFRVHRFWQRLHPAPGILPGRLQLRVADILDLLPNLWLLDIERDGRTPRFRYRLVGTAIVDALGGDPTGRWVHVAPGLDPDAVRTIARCLGGIVDSRRPYWRSGPPLLPALSTGCVSRVESLVLPLASDGVTPDILLGYSVFMNLDGVEYRPFGWAA